MKPEIVITVGLPGSGKSTYVKSLTAQGYRRINRDQVGGDLAHINSLSYQALRVCYKMGDRHFVLDNTFTKADSRAILLEVARGLDLPVRVLQFPMNPDQAGVFAARRQVQTLGRLLRPEEYADFEDDDNVFPPGLIRKFLEAFEPPTLDEGFDSIEVVDVPFVWGEGYTNKAIILDPDTTIRGTGNPPEGFPPTPESIVVNRDRRGRLVQAHQDGFLLLAAANMSGYQNDANAVACNHQMITQLGLNIDVVYTLEQGGPSKSFWRKPQPGMAVLLIEKYKLDPSQCILVSDRPADSMFAGHVGFQHMGSNEFFG